MIIKLVAVKRILLITVLFMLGAGLHAQYAEDALRYSQIYWQGTARSMATGSAFSALGADFLSLSTNPGGIGVYRSRYFSITPEVFVQKVNSEYNGTPTNGSKTIFDLSNIGYVLSKKLGQVASGWKYWQIGFGMNRLNNYNGNLLMQGTNAVNSKLDVYNEEANGVNYTELDNQFGKYAFDLSPAWYAYLLDTIPGTQDQYYTAVPYGGVLQSQQILTKGSTNEFLVSGGANFNDVLYLGATLGLPYLRYFRTSVYTETDVADTIPYFNSWSYTEDLKTQGWGINLKIGAIIRPIDWIRIGVAFHTPTYYFSMKDSWSTVTYADLGPDWQKNIPSPDGEYKYHLTTPMRLIGSLAFVIKEIGFITGEYEYVNYSQSKFKAGSYDFNVENSNIKNFYKSVSTFRIGTEWRIAMVSLRAGYALYGSPYANNLNDGARQYITGGIGYRGKGFELDFSYSRATQNEDYYFYSTHDIQSYTAHNSFLNQQFALTFKYIINK